MEFVSEHRRKATIKYHHQNNLPTIQMWNSHQQREPQAEAMEACVLNVNNMNPTLTPPQKELLRWHFHLCHQGFDSLQWLLQLGILETPHLPVQLPNVIFQLVLHVSLPKPNIDLLQHNSNFRFHPKPRPQTGSTLPWAMGFHGPFHGH